MDRQLADKLKDRLKKWRSTALLGSRQVGKSYLLKWLLARSKGTLITFDDPREREEAKRDPVHYLETRYREGNYLFIDEAAKVPEIFNAVKILVDRYDPKPTGICLANSGNYLRLRKVKESLAGRVSLLTLYPFSWQEYHGFKNEPGLLQLLKTALPKHLPKLASEVSLNRQREERMLWGGYPEPTLKERDARILWAREYVRTYVLPLIIEQFNIRDTLSFEQAARLLILQNSQFLNVSKLAQRAGISQPTMKNYSHFLEAMMIVHLVPAYWGNPKKRLVKQPKVYVSDPLLFNECYGNDFVLQRYKEKGEVGILYESFIFNEIKKTISNYDQLISFYTWRTQDKAEVDIVLSAKGKLFPFEVKWSSNLTKRDTFGLQSFMECYPKEASKGYIIYPGQEIKKITNNITAVPDWWLLGCY
jgi:uncharacterized protein